MLPLLLLALAATVAWFWVKGNPIAAVAVAVGLILPGAAATWFLPYPYDYADPHTLDRFKGIAAAIAIAMAPIALRRLLRLPSHQPVGSRDPSAIGRSDWNRHRRV